MYRLSDTVHGLENCGIPVPLHVYNVSSAQDPVRFPPGVDLVLQNVAVTFCAQRHGAGGAVGGGAAIERARRALIAKMSEVDGYMIVEVRGGIFVMFD